MNQTLETMLQHKSDRSYTSQPVGEAQLDLIVRAAYQGPTSINSQQVSLVVVRDPARRARLAEIAGGQPWVAQAPVFICVVVDLHKTAQGLKSRGVEQQTHLSVEGLVAGVLDAGIALGNLMTAAHSLGLGVVPIGGIRRDPLAVAELLKLPKLCFPVNGVCIGHVDKPALAKPRLAISTFRHDEAYSSAGLDAAIAAYDAELMAFWQAQGRANGQPWSESVAGAYKQVYYTKVKEAVIRQGFTLER
jgi:FMN reductase [NAD(P)H]